MTDNEVMQLAKKHPRYLADGGALFGAPPLLVCQYCREVCYELFYGHCKACAKASGVPMQYAEPQAFHDAFASGTSTVIQGIPAEWTAKPPRRSWWRRALSALGRAA